MAIVCDGDELTRTVVAGILHDDFEVIDVFAKPVTHVGPCLTGSSSVWDF